LEAVIWDDDHIPAGIEYNLFYFSTNVSLSEAAASTPLLLDLNDKEMLFSENIKQPVIEKPPELPPPPEGISLFLISIECLLIATIQKKRLAVEREGQKEISQRLKASLGKALRYADPLFPPPLLSFNGNA